VLKKNAKKFLPLRRVLFYRDFQVFSGGHQKVADYYGHLVASKEFEPSIGFSDSSVWDQSNPWLGCDSVDYAPLKYDYVFLAGMDWQKYLSVDRPHNQPVINLIQHVRHADPSQDVFPYLKQRAVRICVSKQVANAIESTGQVNGPVFTFPNGVELPLLHPQRTRDVIVLGIKQPALARELYDQLVAAGLSVLCIDKQVPRPQLFELMSSSRVAVLLPHTTEGFYLPALEAMNYCDMVVVPDCVGNRDFCKDGKNCIMPNYNREAILASTMHAIELLQNEHVLTEFKRNMRQTVQQYSLENERKAFLDLMKNLDKIWSQ
jgi:hypothetical protein